MSVRVRLNFDPSSSPLRLVPPPAAAPASPADPERLNETLPLLKTLQPRPASLAAGPEVRCIRCEGRLAPGRAPVRLERPGFRLAWEALPAWICGRCDASYFEPREVHLIRRALDLMRRLASGPHA